MQLWIKISGTLFFKPKLQSFMDHVLRWSHISLVGKNSSFPADPLLPISSNESSLPPTTHHTTVIFWLVVLTPLKNISQLGILFPIYGKIKNVPNHQPAIYRTQMLSWMPEFWRTHWIETTGKTCPPHEQRVGCPYFQQITTMPGFTRLVIHPISSHDVPHHCQTHNRCQLGRAMNHLICWVCKQ